MLTHTLTKHNTRGTRSSFIKFGTRHANNVLFLLYNNIKKFSACDSIAI